MKGEKITFSQRQLKRVRVISLVEAGKITLKEAAEKIGRSYRKTPDPSDCKGTQQKILQLSQRLYGEINDFHVTEVLTERKKIK
jgi:hypothetical protein